MVAANDPATRLRLGAAVLGKFWRRGDRCASKWDAVCLDSAHDKTDFCKAKMQWVRLSSQCGGSLNVGSEYAVIEGMLASEFDVSGLTMTISHPTHGRMKVGPRGSVRLRDLLILASAQGQVPGTIKILEAFPGATLEGTSEPG